MIVRIDYTYEVDKDDYSKLRKKFSLSEIRDMVFGGFVIGGEYAVSQDLMNMTKSDEVSKAEYDHNDKL